MSQDGADTGRGCAVAEHISRGGVPQEVSAVAGRLDPRSNGSARATICVTAARVRGRIGAKTDANISVARSDGRP